MAKRFTDTSKWTNNKWFFELSVESKLFWIYLLDSCDQVGVWEENVMLASRIIGYTYSMDTLLEDFEKQIHVFRNGRKWWIRDFCRYQYGEMNEDSASKPIQSHIKLLKNHGLWIEYTKGIYTLKDKDKDKEEDKDKEKDKEKERKKKEIIYPFDTETFKKWWELWREYKKDEHDFKYKSEISEQAALKELANLSNGVEEDALRIIEQSLTKGWKGLFKIKDEFKGSGDLDKYEQELLTRMQS